MSLSPLELVFWSAAVLGVLLAASALRSVVALRLLPRQSGVTSRPRVTVVVAARDEEVRVETTVRGLLAQEGVELDVVVVDDRSADRTGDILRRLAADDPRLSVVRVDVLPDGWLGKCHACYVGADGAAGEWVLFTDADIWLTPDVVARAVTAAEAERADHITLWPGVRRATFLGSVSQLLFGLGMGRRALAVNHDVPGAHLGVGAFNLVRAAAYRAVGGYEALQMEVVDDLRLGLLLRRGGFRSRVYYAPRDVDADWCPDALGMLKGLEKNHFAATDYRLSRVLVGGGLLGGFWAAAVIGPWTGTPAGLAAGLALLSLAVPAAVAARRLGWPVAAAPLVPLFLPMLVACLLNSAVTTLWRGGVRWRDTFYPLAALRAGVVR